MSGLCPRCAGARYAPDPFLILPAPVVIPPLNTRASELPRIIDEYAADAVQELFAEATGAPPPGPGVGVAHILT